MTDAPERIRIKPCHPRKDQFDWYVAISEGGTEYVRADLIAELEAEVERLRTSLWMVKAVINAEYMGKTTFEYLAGVVGKALTPKEPTNDQ